MNYNLVKTYVFIVIAGLTLLSVSSCDIFGPDNNYYGSGFDSARYSWKIDTLGLNGLGLCVTDTGNYIILQGRWLLQYHNGVYSYLDFPDESMFAESYFRDENNNIFLGGYTYDGVKVCPAAYVLNGGVFQKLILKLDSIPVYFPVYSIQCISSDKSGNIWLGSSKGDIIKYDGFNYTHFKTDTSYRIRNFFYDGNSNFSAELLHYSISGNEPPRHAVFKFNGSQWTSAYYYEDLLVSGLIPFKMEYSLYAFKINRTIQGKDDGVYIFNNNNFDKVFDFLPFRIDKIDYAGGAGLNNFALNGYIAGNSVNSYPQYLFHWNGIRFSKEFRFNGALINSVARDFKIFDNHLFVLYDTDDFIFLMKGTLK
ncbi:MAG: hypothetical protein LWX07_00745 [Bacteroidetes bacterium]|nr:hypothetical protein [Bacteroidota bacterium]